jgi:hypothetical protein
MAELKVYEPGPATDILLARWWDHMAGCGDLELVFESEYALLSRFMAGFQAPTVLLYAEDADGIYFAMWADPIMSGAFFGFWMRSDKRPSETGDVSEAYELSHSALDTFLANFPVMLIATRDPHIVQLAQRLGGKLLGVVPHIFDGSGAFVCYLTREDFASYKAQGQPNGQGRQQD